MEQSPAPPPPPPPPPAQGPSRKVALIFVAILAAIFVGAGVLKATSGGGGDPAAARTHACALVRYWADTSGTVPFPDADAGVTTASEVTDLAQTGWPDNAGTRVAFLQLYNGLTSNMSDADYATEANSFEVTNCS